MTHSEEDTILVSDGEFYPLELQPFPHQVSGCHVILEINQSSICKPYSEREVIFYKNIPVELRRFTPQFKGVIDIQCHQGDSETSFIGDISRSLVNDKETYSACIMNNKKKRKHRFTGEFEPKDWNHCKFGHHLRICKENAFQSKKFIILGNLLETYERPSVMDIKLGRRERPYFPTEENKQKHEDRCALSTSLSMGFRINGTQVYKCNTDMYVRHDKVYGRNLDLRGVQRELEFFFHNGTHLRIDVIQPIVAELKCLQEVIANQNIFHLFACSLLLIYDNTIHHLNPEISANEIKDFSSCEMNDLEEVTDQNRYFDFECTGKLEECRVGEFGRNCSQSDYRTVKSEAKLIDFGQTFFRDVGNSCIDSSGLDLSTGLQNLIQILENFLATEKS